MACETTSIDATKDGFAETASVGDAASLGKDARARLDRERGKSEEVIIRAIGDGKIEARAKD